MGLEGASLRDFPGMSQSPQICECHDDFDADAEDDADADAEADQNEEDYLMVLQGGAWRKMKHNNADNVLQ